jgi:sulfur carrier protein
MPQQIKPQHIEPQYIEPQHMEPRHIGPLTAVLVNGERTETGAGSLAELLAQLGYGEEAVATALNGAFVPRRARGGTPLRPGDKIEIVAPRQGG